MKRSSVVAVTRGHGPNLEVFWSQRRYEMAFLGGFWAFAGGGVEGDDEIPLSCEPPAGFPDRDYFGCAARELFEEIGIWVTDDGLKHVTEDAELARLRDTVRTGGDFARLLRERGERVDVDRFWPIGRWITPDWFDIRFDSEFFVLQLSTVENERVGAALSEHLLEAELIRGEWSRPGEAISAWRSGARFMTPPIRYVMEAFEHAETARDVDVDSSNIDFQYDAWLATEGIYVIPLRSPTIPPATHTNCIIVGEEELVVIDPGSPFRSEQELLERSLDGMVDDGRQLLAVVLTHHHSDHVGGVSAVVERYGCEVWAHEETAERVAFDVDRQLVDAERIELGRDSLECLFTPGHASGHLSFLHERTGGVIVGDLIASRGTILVNPPDGHMGDYLASLRRVRDLEPSVAYPAHGWIVTNPVERLQFYVDHRLEREEKVYRALQRYDAPATAADIVPDAYDDAPKSVWPIAARSAEAHLVHLEESGRVELKGGKWKVV